MSHHWAVDKRTISRNTKIIWYANVCRIHVWDIMSTLVNQGIKGVSGGCALGNLLGDLSIVGFRGELQA